MPSRSRRKPSDPQDAARRRAERAETEGEIVRLRSTGAVVKLDRTRRIVGAYRANPFRKLKDANTITLGQSNAADRLCEDWAIWKGLDGKPAPLEIHNPNWSHQEFLTDRMLLARARVDRVLGKVGPADRDLLAALVASAVEDDRPIPWRDIVRRVTGVTQTVRQSQMVVAALENLTRAYALH
jgi:hypothetical protein